MLSNGSAELSRVFEDGSPFLNGSKIVTHILAAVKSLGDLKDHNCEFKDSLNFWVPAVLVKLVNSPLDFVVHQVTTIVA